MSFPDYLGEVHEMLESPAMSNGHLSRDQWLSKCKVLVGAALVQALNNIANALEEKHD